MLAPIILFAFVRLDTLMQTVSSLKNNFLAEDSDLFIYIDGPKNDVQRELQKPIISYLNDLCGFKTITIKTSVHNKGLDPSIVPFISKTKNIGFNDLAEHCKPIKYNRLKSYFDYSEITEFVLPYDII